LRGALLVQWPLRQGRNAGGEDKGSGAVGNCGIAEAGDDWERVHNEGAMHCRYQRYKFLIADADDDGERAHNESAMHCKHQRYIVEISYVNQGGLPR